MLKLPTENTLDREEKIMVEWIDVLLSDILMDKGYIRGPFGSALKRGDMKEDGIPVYEQQHAIYNSRDFRYYIDEQKFNEMKRFQVKKDDLIISCSGTVGKVSIIKDDDPKGIISQALLLLRADTNKVLPLYLKYFFSSREGYSAIVSRSSGSVQVNIAKRSVIEQIPLKLPQIKTQRKIVGVLSSIDKKIKENERINNNLEQQYISIVDNLLSKLTQYKIYSLLEVADCQNGRAFYKEGYDPNGAFVIDLGNVNTSGNFVRTAADKYISLDRYKEPKLEKYRVYKNDIVMVMTDRKSTMELLGKVGKIYKDGYYLLNQRMYRIRAKEGINTNYLYACLNSTETSNFLKRKALGSVQKYVNTGEINSIEIKVPSSEKMEEIASILDPIFLQMESNILENESLNELRDILLPKLMSGELDVSGIDL